MKEAFVSDHAARTHLSQLLARVEAEEVIIIARGKTPVAKLIPMRAEGKREFGTMRGNISIGPEFFEPLSDEELDPLDQ